MCRRNQCKLIFALPIALFNTQLQKVLPEGHPDVDDLFLDHEELPEWHPDLNLVVQDNPIEPIYVFR